MPITRPNEEVSWANFGVRILINTASHPLEYAKVLIQIGHEPIAPYPTTNIFGRPCYALPNVFQYVAYIKSVDGFIGCYRGLGPKLCSNIVSNIVFQRTAHAISPPEPEEKPYEEMTDEERHAIFVRDLIRDVGARGVAVIASQPFNVIALRMMAQFVGGETKYTGILGSIMEVYRENGFSGFFSGLTPRLIAEIAALVIAAVLTHTVNRCLVEDRELQSYTSICMTYFAGAITYPLQVVSNTMSVNNCGLIAGLPPHMPVYTNWLDCWAHLKQGNQLKRGSSLIWRYYSHPQVAGSFGGDRKNVFALGGIGGK